jgi:Arc/MetJ-type ribon-helix-helix transcriptional regulator
MATRIRLASAPLTFDLPLSLISKIELYRRGNGFRTASDVIRLALERSDFESFKPARDPHRQISVRISPKQRAMLRRYARAKRASVGELLRCALEELPAEAGRKSRR